jgi:hypothetical protein
VPDKIRMPEPFPEVQYVVRVQAVPKHSLWLIVTEEMVGGQRRVDEQKRAEQVRVTPMNRSNRDRRGLCADEEVGSNLVITKRKNPRNGRRR